MLLTKLRKRQTSKAERRLQAERDVLAQQLREAAENLEIAKSKSRVLEEQVKQLTTAFAFMQQRWERATANLGDQAGSEPRGLGGVQP